MKSIFTETHYFLESLFRGVSNPPLRGARLDGLHNLTFGGPHEFLADRLDHADSLLVIVQIVVWHTLAYSCTPFENHCLSLWGGYNPVSLCVRGYNLP